jgi:tetratricopeptide (TPR) repeat protein
MKLIKLLTVLFVFSLVLGTRVFAQEEMTEEQWMKAMDEGKAKKEQLTATAKALSGDIENLNAKIKEKDAAIKTADGDLKNLLAKEGDYKKSIEDLEKIVKDKDKSGKKVEDAEKMYADLNANPLKCWGDYASRLAKIKKEIDLWKTPVVVSTDNYSVVKGDCLWKIANLKYKEPKAWFAIWEKNKDGVVSAPPKVAKTIKNPNLIYPGQVLKIPALNDADKKAAVANTNKYIAKHKWGHKRVKKEDVKKDDKKDVKKDDKKDVKKDVKKDDKKDVKKDVKKDDKKDVKKDDKKK